MDPKSCVPGFSEKGCLLPGSGERPELKASPSEAAGSIPLLLGCACDAAGLSLELSVVSLHWQNSITMDAILL